MPQDSSTVDPSEGIHVSRTYRRCDLIKLLPGGCEELIRQLEVLYGLLPLGGQTPLYFGQNIVESLIRHAKNERVQSERRSSQSDAH